MTAVRFSRRGTGLPVPRCALFVTAALAALLLPGANAAPQPAAPAPASPGVLGAYGRLPLAFVPNAGQTDARVRFAAHAAGAQFYFTRSEAVFAFTKGSPRDGKGVALRLVFLGANPDATIDGQGRQAGKVNYFIGNDPKRWRTNLPTYGRVVYRDLWPGIDMVFRGDGTRLKYEFVVRPGANVDDIRLAYRGAERLSVNAAGQLLIETPLGTLRDARPVTYQEIEGKRVPVESRFLLRPTGPDAAAYGFAVGGYDARQPLVIDPGLLYSTFLGGGSTDIGNPIAVDAAGNAYVTGETNSGAPNPFPTTAGAFDTSYNGNIDAFVTKLNPTGSALVYSTYLGGAASSDRGFGITVDGAGNAYVTGETNSMDFPTTLLAFDTSYDGNGDAFVTKLNVAGSALLYSTYFGGTSTDRGSSIGVDAAANAHVTGATNSTGLATGGAFDTSYAGGFDVFVTKLDATGSARVYSTYLGGTSDDRGFGIAADTAGNAYVTGETNSSSGFGMTGSFDPMPNGSFDAFVTKLNPTGSARVYSTYLGGSSDDRGFGIALDAALNAYVTGETSSSSDVAMSGGFDTSHNGGFDVFVTKLSSTGASRVYSTYLGGSAADRGFGIAVDGSGNAYLTGETDSTGFPTTTGAFDTGKNGIDAFVSKVSASGSSLLYSTFLGGTNADRAFGIAVDTMNNAYVTGRTDSSNFPITAGAFDTTFNNNGDAFVTKLDMVAAGAPTLSINDVSQNEGNAGATAFTFTVTRSGSTAGTTTVNYATADGTATGAAACPGPDYQSQMGTLTFAPTVTSQTITILVCGDTTFEPNETFFVNLSGAIGATISDGQGVGTIVNDDAAPPATLELDPPTATNTVGSQHTVTATVEDQFGNPTPGIVVRFSVTGANTASGSNVTDTNGQASFTYTGTTVGTDTISAFADTNANGVQDNGEPGDTASKTWTPGPPATLTLSPPTDENTVGDEHCVTATVKGAFGNPTPGITVRFTVTGATFPSPSSGSDVTDANGDATFCYSASLPGEDAITAYADTNNDATQDAGEPTGAATKTWTPPPSTAFCEVKITQGGWIVALNGDRASFGGNAKVDKDGNVQGSENYQDHGPAQPRHVKSIELLATTCSDDLRNASIFGTATIDGSGTFVFRIDVMDQGEPGTNDSYGIMLSDGYVSGQRQLQGGNVQIHKN
jgi:hypothetical protein